MAINVDQNQGYNQYSEVYQFQLGWNSTQKLITEELIRATRGKNKILDLLGPAGLKALKKFKGGDLKENLMLLLEIILAELDQQIIQKINDLRKVSKQLKGVSKKEAENHPGLVSGLNTDSSVLQQMLTMLVQKRQRIVEAITNALKSVHDSDMNSIRRII